LYAHNLPNLPREIRTQGVQYHQQNTIAPLAPLPDFKQGATHMTTYRKILVCLLIVLPLLLSWGSPPASGQSSPPENKVPARVETQAQRLMADLKKQGFEVSEGYFRLYTQDDCPDSYAAMGTCYFNNPAAPYVIYSVPPWSNEYVDPATQLAFGQNEPGYSTTFRFDPREAVVILGTLPPPAKYFGLQSYIYTRQGKYDTDSLPYRFFEAVQPNILSTFFGVVPENHKRVQLFASLSNSINNVVIEDQSGAAFNQERVFIITPDQFMNRTVRAALGVLSVEEKDIFTEPIPGNLRIGLNKRSDDFVTFIRYSMPDVEADADQWRSDLPLRVFRIRDTRPGRKAEPYPPVKLDPRTAQNELYLQPDLINLIDAVSQKWGMALHR